MFFHKEQVFIRLFCFVESKAVAGRFFGKAGFKLLQDFGASPDNRFRHTSQLGDMQTIAFVGSAGQNLVQENNFIHPFANGHVTIFDVRK